MEPSSSNIASGNIRPCRFVALVAASPGKVIECAAASTPIFGISQMGIRLSMLLETTSPPRAAADGEMLGVFVDGQECLLEIGGTVAAGDKLTSDGSGKGITTVTDRNEYGAVALEDGISGRQIRVRVQKGQISL